VRAPAVSLEATPGLRRHNGRYNFVCDSRGSGPSLRCQTLSEFGLRPMESQKSASVTGLLLRWRQGEQECLNQIIPLIQAELHRIARWQMRSEPLDHTLQATALVNEAYMRLVDQNEVTWINRAHFLAVAARLMRHLLVDHARGLRRKKRGGDACFLPLDEGMVFAPGKSAELIELDEALERLLAFDQRKARIVELRYFGGMSVEETAAVLQVSANTVIRDWGLAKVWLKHELATKSDHGG
jgi:RNA polymerase sigma-70 factor, ECF subfamily